MKKKMIMLMLAVAIAGCLSGCSEVNKASDTYGKNLLLNVYATSDESPSAPRIDDAWLEENGDTPIIKAVGTYNGDPLEIPTLDFGGYLDLRTWVTNYALVTNDNAEDAYTTLSTMTMNDFAEMDHPELETWKAYYFDWLVIEKYQMFCLDKGDHYGYSWTDPKVTLKKYYEEYIPSGSTEPFYSGWEKN
jgi:hypothetical protein